MDPTTEGTTLSSSFNKSLHWSDYLVLATFLLANIAIGLWQNVKAKEPSKQMEPTAEEEYLVGGRQMNPLPAGLSLAISFMSGILILGGSSQIYTSGTLFWLTSVSFSGSALLSSFVWVPLLYRLKLTSSMEYLEKRFHSQGPKTFASFCQLLFYILYSGVGLYTAATGLTAVSGYPEWSIIIVVGSVTTLYSAIGGLKGSMYASILQTGLLTVGLLFINIKGCIDVGGIKKVWDIASETNRLTFADFDPSPFKAHSTWTLLIGGLVFGQTAFGLSQSSVQRYNAVSTLRRARQVLWWASPGLFLIPTIVCHAGLTMYAWYQQVGCDPIAAGYVTNANQLIAYYVLDTMDYVCVPGLFVSCVIAASMGMMSAALGALASTTWVDFIKPMCGCVPQERQLFCIRSLVVVYGCVAMCFAYLTSQIGGNVIELTIGMTGAAQGPILGLFVVAAFFPCAQKIGAVVGASCGLIMTCWVVVGSLLNPATSASSTVSNSSNCTQFIMSNVTDAPTSEPPSGLGLFYHMSYMYYTSFGAAITVIVGLIVSCLTGCSDPADVDPRYHLPVFDWFCCYLPMSTLGVLRCVHTDDKQRPNGSAMHVVDPQRNNTGVHVNMALSCDESSSSSSSSNNQPPFDELFTRF